MDATRLYHPTVPIIGLVLGGNGLDMPGVDGVAGGLFIANVSTCALVTGTEPQVDSLAA